MATLLYNPDRKSKEELISEFVVRTDIYNEIMKDLTSSDMKHPEQHYLIVGQRGTGKTTLLNRIKYGIEDDKKLNGWLIPLLFSEEQYYVNELVNIWESVAEFLEDYHGFDHLAAEIKEHSQKKNYEELALDILEKRLKKHKKKIVVLLDNLGDTLKKLDKNEVRRLREILQTRAFIRLIAATPFYLEETIDYHQPFYEFFKLIRVDSLNLDDTKKLLLRLAKINGEEEKINRIIKSNPGRIEVLRTLTGGVPRTIVLMFNIFLESDEDSSVKDLERILDAVTPLYKHRMDDLPTQQQKIVHAVAISWDAISVKDLKDKVRLESKVVSAQLQQLEKNQVIDKVETSTKNNLYLLRERFFNIWYLMRYGRKDDKQRVIWLVRFLESWCSIDDIKIRIHGYVNKLKNKQIDEKAAEFFGHVYSGLKDLDMEDKLLLKSSSPKKVSNAIKISDEQISEVIEKYAVKKDWMKVLEYSAQLVTLTKNNKVLIFEAVLNTDSVPDMLAELFDRTKSDNISDSTGGAVEIFLSSAFVMMEFWSITYESEHFKTALNTFLRLSMYEVNKEQGIIDQFFTIMICRMLAKNQFNLAGQVFEENKKFNLTERFKALYYAVLYFRDGPESTGYRKAGPELQESIKQIIARVKTLK